MIKIAVTGGRNYKNENRVYTVLSNAFSVYGDRMYLIIGDCRTGLDAIAKEWAQNLGVEHKIYVAEWSKYGNIAGPIRNEEMIKAGPKFLIAFPGGAGTYNCISIAEHNNIPVIKVLT